MKTIPFLLSSACFSSFCSRSIFAFLLYSINSVSISCVLRDRAGTCDRCSSGGGWLSILAVFISDSNWLLWSIIPSIKFISSSAAFISSVIDGSSSLFTRHFVEHICLRSNVPPMFPSSSMVMSLSIVSFAGMFTGSHEKTLLLLNSFIVIPFPTGLTHS